MSQCHIYQTNAAYRFESWDNAKNKFNFNDYIKIYSGELLDEVKYCGCIIKINEKDSEILKNLYEQFTANIPQDYRGRPMSVSDVIEIVRADGSHYYYCDRIGFTEIQL